MRIKRELEHDKSGEFPFVIGVVGHRNLNPNDILSIKKEVLNAICELKRRYFKDDQSTRLQIMSSLAEGADQLVAQVGINEGMELIVPLPMNIEDFQKDFDDNLFEDSYKQFLFLLSKARQVIDVSKIKRFQSYDTNFSLTRESKYQQAGRFILQHCHVLLAIWDFNTNNEQIAGTSEMVRRRFGGSNRKMILNNTDLLTDDEIGPAILIHAPRRQQYFGELKIFTKSWPAVLDGDPVEQKIIWENLEKQIFYLKLLNSDNFRVSKCSLLV